MKSTSCRLSRSTICPRVFRREATDTVPIGSSIAGAEEIDDGAGGWEGIALGRGKADIECGFELVAELDQVEGVTSEVADKGGVEAPTRMLRECQRRKTIMPIRIIAAETTYPTRCIRWMR